MYKPTKMIKKGYKKKNLDIFDQSRTRAWRPSGRVLMLPEAS